MAARNSSAVSGVLVAVNMRLLLTIGMLPTAFGEIIEVQSSSENLGGVNNNWWYVIFPCSILGSLWIISMWFIYRVGKKHGASERQAAISTVLHRAASNQCRAIFYSRGFPEGELKFCAGLRNARHVESSELCLACSSWQHNIPELAAAVQESS